MYGYQIKQEIFIRSIETIEIKEGSLYGPFYRLENKKMITSAKVMAGKKRFRMYYHIDDLGMEYLSCAIKAFKSIYSGAKKYLMVIKMEKKI